MVVTAFPRAARPAALLLVAALAGCANIDERTADVLFAAPGRYNGYTCEQLGRQLQSAQTRERELQEMMARAEKGAGGAVVNAIAYRSDHYQARAEMKLIGETASTKNCTSETLREGGERGARESRGGVAPR